MKPSKKINGMWGDACVTAAARVEVDIDAVSLQPSITVAE